MQRWAAGIGSRDYFITRMPTKRAAVGMQSPFALSMSRCQGFKVGKFGGIF